MIEGGIMDHSASLLKPPSRLRIVADPDPLPSWITPEMIEAGALILVEYGGLGSYTAKHLAEDVYRAMELARAESPISTD